MAAEAMTRLDFDVDDERRRQSTAVWPCLGAPPAEATADAETPGIKEDARIEIDRKAGIKKKKKRRFFSKSFIFFLIVVERK